MSTEIDAAQAAELLDAKRAVALDVRGEQEWIAGRIPHALHVPDGSLSQVIAGLSDQLLIIVVCRSGVRSRAAADDVRLLGFRAVSLAGGMRAWWQAGLRIEPTGGRVA